MGILSSDLHSAGLKIALHILLIGHNFVLKFELLLYCGFRSSGMCRVVGSVVPNALPSKHWELCT